MGPVETILLAIGPILLAVSLHEAAHGMVANWLGDTTAKDMGRLTANPVKHIDPVGTILVPLILVLTIGIPFGWARPVPVDPSNFQNPLKDMALVALAGPMANFLMSLFWVMLLVVVVKLLPQGAMSNGLKVMAVFGIQINAVLMILNLLPVPPLDGGRIVTGIMPPKFAMYFIRYERVGMILVILLLVSGFLGTILTPLVKGFQLKLYSVFGLL